MRSSTSLGLCLLLAIALPVVAASPARIESDRRPFLLGGIQLNEDDHERWAATLIQAGMNAVEVTVYAHQGAWDSPDLWFADEEPAVLAEIRAARRNGLQVVLILRVALDHNDPANRFLWHGLIYPRAEGELAEWFNRYTQFVVKWARAAQAEGVEVLGVASEMSSLEATLPVEEIPELPAYYLDDVKQRELRQLVARHLHSIGDADRIAMGAGDFPSLEDFLVERNRAERRWARAYTFAADDYGTGRQTAADRIAKINRRRRLQEGHWQLLIERVRAVYSGRLTLAANFDNYHQISFWDRLDLIGINAYFPLRAALETPLGEPALTESWRRVFAQIEAFRQARDLSQPVIFTELGYTRSRGVTVAPWSSSGFVPLWGDKEDSLLLWSAQPVDLLERALAVRALHSAWRQDHLPLAGILYWKLSSRVELGRYEPFMLYLGADSQDPLFAAFGRFAGEVRPLDPPAAAAGDLYARRAEAVARGDVEALVRFGAGAGGSPEGEGRPPLLHLAVRWSRGEVIRLLLRRGADLAARDAAGYLPLHWSCYQRDPSLVALLLPPDNVSWRDDLGETPMMKCARLDNVPVMRQLLRHGGDLAAAAGTGGRTPLRLAADLASAEMVGLLLRHGAGADPDAAGVTPLHAAARRGDPEIVELLSSAAAGERADLSGNRPLAYAAYFGQVAAFRLLWNVDAARLENAGGQSLLHLAAHGGAALILETLLRHGLAVNQADDSGRTPLHYATLKTHLAAVRLLLEHGAAVDRADHEGIRVLHLAAERDDPQLLQLLLAGALDPDVAGAGGNTPLHYAASWGRLENVRLLLAAGAVASRRNDQGQTPLAVAEASGRKRVAELLREQLERSAAPAAVPRDQ